MTLSRFGAQARDDVAVVEKCIIARVRIIDDQGKTVGIRPVHDKYLLIYWFLSVLFSHL